MIELAQHIEVLLLENDCVIVPGLGGFVGHYTPSCKTVEGQILPPTRVIGFNPSLKMNDGLLAQSYASVYGTSFSDATRRIEYQVARLLHQLHEEGKVELPNIGELHYSIYDTFSFLPYDHKLTTPYLYGMCSFNLQELSVQHPVTSQKTIPLQPIQHAAVTESATPHRHTLHIPLRATLLRHTASIVAAILLFFFITTPIENTSVVESNYAQLIPSELFAQIGQTSLVTTPVHLHDAQKHKVVRVKEVKVPAAEISKPILKTRETNQTTQAMEAPKMVEKPIQKKVEKPIQKPVEHTVQKPLQTSTQKPAITRKAEKPYYIIVASVSSEADARRMAEQLKQNGYPTASAVIGGGKMRVSIQACQTQQEAYQSLKKIRTNAIYQTAWVLH